MTVEALAAKCTVEGDIVSTATGEGDGGPVAPQEAQVRRRCRQLPYPRIFAFWPRTPPRSAHPSPSAPPAGSAARSGPERPPGAGRLRLGGWGRRLRAPGAGLLVGHVAPDNGSGTHHCRGADCSSCDGSSSHHDGRLLFLVVQTAGGSAVECGFDQLAGDAGALQQHPAGIPHGRGERAAQTSSQMSRAADELGSNWAAANSMSSGPMSPPTSPSSSLKPATSSEFVDLEGEDVPLGVLADEDEVEDPHGAGLDEGDQLGCDPAG